MFCHKCGRPQAEDATFCGECGTRIARVAGPWPEPPVPGPSSTCPANVAGARRNESSVTGARLDIEEWAVSCSPPDSDGDVRFEAKVRCEFHGSASAHLARLSWIAFDASGSIPLLLADNTLNQDIDDEDSVEIEAGSYGKLGEGVDAAHCNVRGQLVLYPGEKHAPWTIPLPEAGQAGGEGPAWPDTGAEIAGWRLACSDSTDESASYSLFMLARNTGASPLAAVTFRIRLKNRKGDVWSTEHLAIERLAPGEMRGVETTLYLSERAKARRGAVVEVTAIVASESIVHQLEAVVVAFNQERGSPEDVESLQDNRRRDDGSNGMEEPEASSGEPMEATDMANKSAAKSVTWAPKPGKAGVWTFYPNAKVRKDYPACDRDHTGLDCQEGEVLSLVPRKTERLGKTLVVTTREGRIELGDFDACWHEVSESAGEDCVIWDIYRIVEEWSSD